MRWFFRWFLLSCRRFLKRPAFLLLLILLPAVILAAARLEGENEGTIRVALYTADQPDSLAGRTVQDLTAGKDGAFSFFVCKSEEALGDAVAAGRAECGFVFRGDLDGRFLRGETKRSIRLYKSPSTVTDGLAEEAVFAALARRYVKKLFLNYAEEQDFFADGKGKTATLRLAGELYDNWLNSGRTFRFVFETTDNTGRETENSGSAAAFSVFPARGLLAVWIVLASLIGTWTLQEDETRGLFLPLPAGCRLPCALACIAAPAALAAASGLIALLSAGGCSGRSFLRESAALAAYVLLLLFYCLVLKKLTASPKVLLCLTPFLMTGSLTFCPVFADIGHFIPVLGRLGLLFPPCYYIRFF